MFVNPVADLHVILVRVLGKARSLGLLRGEEAMLGLCGFEEPSLCVSTGAQLNLIATL